MSRSKVFVTLAFLAVSLSAAAVARAQNGAWSQLSPGTGPSARHGHTAIYDATNQRMIVFGGENGSGVQSDAWALSLGCSTPAWTLLSSGGPARTEHSAIYDPSRQRMLVFGGEDASGNLTSDVWALSLSGTPTWTQLTTSGTAPCARSGHTAVYDVANDRMIVFGGLVYFCSGSPPCASKIETQGNFALSLGTSAWTPYVCHEGANCVPINGVTCTDRPSPRQYHTAIANGTNQMVVFGGWYEDNQEAFNDTYSWNMTSLGDSWTNLSPGGSVPGIRENHRSVYDSINDRMLMFAGDDRNDNGTTYYNDTYALSMGTSPSWSQLSPSGTAPSARSYHSAIFDPVGDRMIVFGGTNGTSDLSDVWALTAPDNTAPAQVTNLSASLDCPTGVVTVTWTAPGDDGNTGRACSYDLRWYNRAITTSNWASTWHLTAPTPQAAGGTETFQDSDLPACTHFYYALETTDDAGNTSVISNNAGLTTPCGACGGGVRSAGLERLSLAAPAPNPASSAVEIGYGIPLRDASTAIELAVYDLAGRRVRLLRSGPAGAGAHAVSWDLRDASGALARPGLYMVRLEAGATVLTRSTLVTR